MYDQLGARRSAAQAISHRLLLFCEESKITANQRRVSNQRYKRWAPNAQYVFSLAFACTFLILTTVILETLSDNYLTELLSDKTRRRISQRGAFSRRIKSLQDLNFQHVNKWMVNFICVWRNIGLCWCETSLQNWY